MRIFLLFMLPLATVAQNVGIGTTAPEARLHIRSTGWIKTIFENDAGQPRGYIGTDNNGTVTFAANAFWNGSAWVYPNSGASFYMLMHRVNNQFEFRVRPDGGSQNTAMVINQLGRVGIGTNSPQQILDINGGIRLGNTNTAAAGTIRYNENKFEGYNGTDWKSFEQLPSGSLISNPIDNNPALEEIGYTFIGGIQGVSTRTPVVANIAANSWLGAGTLAFKHRSSTGHTAVWDGTRMHIWGGATQDDIATPFPYTATFATGASYNPVTNYWDSISTVNAPTARMQHTAVWDGTRMIIWGGRTSNNNGTFTARNDGAIWRPSGTEKNEWTTISSPAIAARYNHTAVWSGTEMMVWGGQSNSTTELNTGARWNGSNWSIMSTTGAPTARIGHTAIWTGSVMIIWGGRPADGSTSFNTGAMYNPANNTWTPVSNTNAPSARSGHSAIWTGTEMIVWGGGNLGTVTNTGARYNPTTNTWTPITTTGSPIGRQHHIAVWTGSEMLVFGGDNGSINRASGGRYNPVDDKWFSMAAVPADVNPDINESASLSKMRAIWTGQQMVLFGGTDSDGTTSSNVCLRYFPQAQTLNTFTESLRTIWLYQKQ
jgi:hypothetical protein